ncbi:MAG: chorismate synthase [Elusimicrobiota bacterium]
MLRYVTAGESHGKQLTVILEGIPAGLPLTAEYINRDLARRQTGFGRGARMKIEKDGVEILSGVRFGETLGSPICLAIKNIDWENWRYIMSAEPGKEDSKNVYQVCPRPGHADLPGAMKFDRRDLRDILERASARETAARVAAGSVCRRLLEEFGVGIFSFVREIGGIKASIGKLGNKDIVKLAEGSPVRTPDAKAEKKMMKLINKAGGKGDTVGGVFTLVAENVIPGLGSHTQWDLKLDGRIARGLMSIQAVKGVEFGIGFEFAERPGSQAHDQIFYSKAKGYYRDSNNAGGVEGGITNGGDIIVSCAMKPIPSLKKPLRSVNIRTKAPSPAEAVRSDVCAVPSAGVIGESALGFELTLAMKEKFGGDSLVEMKTNFNSYKKQIERF